jgi:pyrimidine deaminase RibD-like protein
LKFNFCKIFDSKEKREMVDSSVLENALPISLWWEAFSQSQRSTLFTFKTGAIIFDKDNKILSKGCSHHGIREGTIHAEEHCLKFVGKEIAAKNSILVVTVGKSGNFAYSSRPCFSCVRLMKKYNLSNVYYAERLNHGQWIVNSESPIELWERGLSATCDHMEFARDMRIPD